MAFDLIERISKIPRTEEINNEDIMVVSQSDGTDRKVGNTPVSNVFKFTEDTIIENGVGDLISVGDGLTGTGSKSDPIRADQDFLDPLMLDNDVMDLTMVGYRRTRWLPISRTSLFDSAGYVPSKHYGFPAINVEEPGDLKYIQPSAIGAYTASIGCWHDERTPRTSQIVERRLHFPDEGEGGTVPFKVAGDKIVAVTGYTGTMAVIVVKNPANNYVKYYGVELSYGSLKDQAYKNWFLIATDNPAHPTFNAAMTYFSQKSFSLFFCTSGTYLVSNSISSKENTGTELSFVYINRTNLNNVTCTPVKSWTASSYAGVHKGTNKLVLASSGASLTSVSGQELRVNSKTTLAVEKTGGDKNPVQVQMVQGYFYQDYLYLWVNKEFKLNIGGYKYRYNLSRYFKVTLNGLTSGTCAAVGVTISGTPEIVYDNNAISFKNPKYSLSIDSTYDRSESRMILIDGTQILNVEDHTLQTASTVVFPASKSLVPFLDYDVVDNSQEVIYPKGHEWVLTPGYVGKYTPKTRDLYIASPIYVFMNGKHMYIEPQIMDLQATLDSSSWKTIENLSYSGGKYAGNQYKSAFIYAENAGNGVRLVTRTDPTEDTNQSTLIASFYHDPTGKVSDILYGQAFSRFADKRLNYKDAGSSLPVSYQHPLEDPREIWDNGYVATESPMVYWKNIDRPISNACWWLPLTVKLNLTSRRYGYTFTLMMNGVSQGTKTFTGEPLVWEVIAPSSGTLAEFVTTSSDQTYVQGYTNIGLTAQPVHASPADGNWNYKDSFRGNAQLQIVGSSEYSNYGDVMGCELIYYDRNGNPTTHTFNDQIYPGDYFSWISTVPERFSGTASYRITNKTKGLTSNWGTVTIVGVTWQPAEVSLDVLYTNTNPYTIWVSCMAEYHDEKGTTNDKVRLGAWVDGVLYGGLYTHLWSGTITDRSQMMVPVAPGSTYLFSSYNGGIVSTQFAIYQ